MTVPSSPASGGNAVDKGKTAETPKDPAVEMVDLTIDGLPVSVPKGTLLIRAAEQAGIHIPRFCDHPLLDPVGACRQCLVEVSMPDREGNVRPMPKPQASCTMTASPGMEVKTQHSSAVADKAQHGVMELLLINHPLDCPVCDKGGECPLQNQAMSNGREVTRFHDVKRTFPKPINISSQVLLDRERCVLCARCTRFSDQVAGDPFIALIERGALQQVGIYEEKPFESYFSGNTVQICPVGALTGAAYRFRSRPFDLVSTPSACEHCASGCAQRTDHRRGVVLRRMAMADPQVNEEWNCDKGRWAFKYATTKDVITEPLVRGEDGTFQVASWPEALEAAARGLAKARDERGVGVLTGGRVTAEDGYAYAKFARLVLGTNDVDFRARPHSVEESEFLASNVAGSGLGVTYDDLQKAKSVLLVGFEPEEESPMVFLRLRKAWRKDKTVVRTVAPFLTRGATKMGARLLQAAPGTEAAVLRALSGPDPLGDALDEAREALGSDCIILVGERLATIPGALSAAAALAEATGTRLAWIPRRAGERGALDAGAHPALLPGGRPVADERARHELGSLWGADALPATPGRDTAAMLHDAGNGALSGLLIGGVDPSDLLDSGAARRALARTFVVSLEQRESGVTPYADVVLPVAAVQSKAGTFVDWEGRPREFDAALSNHSMSDYRVLDLLAGEMGEFLGLRSVTEVREELAEAGSWSGTRPAAPTYAPVTVSRPATGQAVLATWHHLLDAGTLQDGEPHLAGTAPKAVARVSAGTAQECGLLDGDTVTVSSDRGSVSVPVVVTDMPDAVVWLPTNSADSPVRSVLGATSGAVVRLSKGGAA